MAGGVDRSLPPGATHVGVDGAGAGWLAATHHGGRWRFETFERFDALRDHLDAPERVLVDVPVGVPETGRRACDEAAKAVLGRRSASVFYAPTEAALSVRRNFERYDRDHDRARAAASDRNEAAGAGGLTFQAWHITDLVVEVDDALAPPPFDGVYREAHPELTFAAFAGRPVEASKSDEEGRERRLDLLADRVPGRSPREGYDVARDRFRKRDASDDDVVDAMALAVAAQGALRTVPADPADGQPRIYLPDVDSFPP